MSMMIIRHKVSDYGKWRPVFDSHSAMQKAAGLSNPRVLRFADNKNEIVVIFDTADTEKSKEFATSSNLKDVMTKAGVIDVPTMYFLEGMIVVGVQCSPVVPSMLAHAMSRRPRPPGKTIVDLTQ